MREKHPHDEMEKALLRLMPSALGESVQASINAEIDALAGDGKVLYHGFSRWAKWVGGIAAAVAFAFLLFPKDPTGNPQADTAPGANEDDKLVVLEEMDRMETFRDEGLFVDAGGSAVRKMTVRVVGESRIRDTETGIEVTLTEPREEMYLMPVSAF